MSHDPTIDAALSKRAHVALPKLIEAARRAGEIALADFRLGERTTARINYKAGNSPVTTADLAVDEFLRRRLAADFPEAGWLSEETVDDPVRMAARELVIADPIDGTRAYMAGDTRWCVALALVVDGRPVAGVVHAPALATTYAASLGAGATRNGERIVASERPTMVGARMGGPPGLVERIAKSAGIGFLTEPRIPSLAYRLARVADGSLDVAVASPDSHDWDIAAAEMILIEAGAGLRDARGARLAYNGATTRRGSLAAAPLALLAELVEALRRATGA